MSLETRWLVETWVGSSLPHVSVLPQYPNFTAASWWVFVVLSHRDLWLLSARSLGGSYIRGTKTHERSYFLVEIINSVS